MNALTFRNTSFDIIDRDGRAWLKAGQIAEALGYADDKAVHRIYARNSDEFTDAMTGVVKLTTAGGEQETRIFSIRGANLIGMKAKTDIAKEFRVWTLDILEAAPLQKSAANAALPHYITQEQAGAIVALIAERFPEGKHRPYAWSRFANHFKLAGGPKGEPAYKFLPASRFDEALAYLAAMPAKEAPALPAPAPAPSALPSPDAARALGMLRYARFVMHFDDNGQIVLNEISNAAMITEPAKLSRMIADHNAIPATLLPGIIQAAASRLA